MRRIDLAKTQSFSLINKIAILLWPLLPNQKVKALWSVCFWCSQGFCLVSHLFWAWTCFLKPSSALLRETNAWRDLALAFTALSNSYALVYNSCYPWDHHHVWSLLPHLFTPKWNVSSGRWEDGSMSCFCTHMQASPQCFAVALPQCGAERAKMKTAGGRIELTRRSSAGTVPWLGRSVQSHRTVGDH